MTSEKAEGRGEAARPDHSKVGRVIDQYGLVGLGEELERRWLGEEGTERMSLRDLATYVNRELVKSALEGAGERPIEGEVENLVDLLLERDTPGSATAQAESKLRRNGIDVDALRRDFVSHQAVHTYLSDVRGASLPEDEPSADEAIQTRQETILRLRNRLVAVTERSLDSLRNAGFISIGTFDVLFSVTIYCDDCGTSYDLADLLRRRACDCSEDAD